VWTLCFLQKKESESSFLTAFDFESFNFLDDKVEMTCFLFTPYSTEKRILIFTSEKLFSWDGCTFSEHCFQKPITNYHLEGNYLLLNLSNEPFIRTYNINTLELISTKKITKDGFFPLLIHTRGDSIIFNCYNAVGALSCCLEYVVKLSINDLLSNEEFKVKIEDLIVEISKCKAGDLFSVKVNVDASIDYDRLVRHACSAIGDAISEHALQFNTPDSLEKCSKDFNGKIKLVISNSSMLSQKQKSDLNQTAECIAIQHSLFNGYAMGENLPLEVACEFLC